MPDSSSSPTEADVEAVAYLRDLAADLFKGGLAPHQIAYELALANLRLPKPFASVDEFVRELPGLSAFDSVADWKRRWANVSDEEMVAGS